MRIIFIYLYGETPQFPFGIGYISGMLKAHGHEAKFGWFAGKEHSAKLPGLISSWQSDGIRFSSMTSTFEKIKELSILIKKQYKDIFIVCGGIILPLFQIVLSKHLWMLYADVRENTALSN